MDRPQRSLFTTRGGAAPIWWDGEAGVIANDAFFGPVSDPPPAEPPNYVGASTAAERYVGASTWAAIYVGNQLSP